MINDDEVPSFAKHPAKCLWPYSYEGHVHAQQSHMPGARDLRNDLPADQLDILVIGDSRHQLICAAVNRNRGLVDGLESWRGGTMPRGLE